MYRLMIADDEDDERMGILYLLNKYGFQFDIIEAADGRDALQKLKENRVDILFTDVKMPFLNGLELSEQVRTISPDTQIIFFSGYDDFEYVKQALSLQAVDYILKPVNPIEFQKVIGLVLDRMEKEAKAQRYNQQFQRMFLLTRLLNQVPFETLQKEYREEELAFLRQYRRLILIEFEEEFFGNVVEDIQELSGRIKEEVDLSYELLDMNPFQGVIFLNNSSQQEGYREIAGTIHRLIEQTYHRKCYLSVSRGFSDPEMIGATYSEAEQYLEDRFFYKDRFIYPIDADKKGEENSEKDGQFLQAIEKDVNFRDAEGLRKDVELLIGKCRNNSFQSYIYTRFICGNLLKLLYQGLPGEEQQLTASVEKIYGCDRFSDIEVMILEVLERVEVGLVSGQDSPRHVTAIVEKYIHEHYMDELSLDVLADKVYLTPHYLSTVFSQEKKIGISKYIKNVRMEKAGELLRNTNQKIQDVCKAVGYSNISYFCKSFRNEYGVTPEKYREQ